MIRRKVETSLKGLPLYFSARARNLDEFLRLTQTLTPKVIFVEGPQYEALQIQARFQRTKVIGFEEREGLLEDPVCFSSYVCSQLQDELPFQHISRLPVETKGLSPSRLIFLGLSTGGPQALELLLPQLRLRSDTALVIAQHMPPGQTQGLAEFIAKKNVPLSEGIATVPLRGGEMVVLPSGCQSYAKADIAGRVSFVKSRFPSKALYAPTIDATLLSFARLYGVRLFAGILTGMGSDGAWGLRVSREWGATTVAEDAATAKVYGMPKVAFQMGGVQTVLRLEQFAEKIQDWQGSRA